MFDAGGTNKDTNPKDAIGITKLPLHLVSPIVKAYQAIAHFLGNVKYGAWNWRNGGARASVYVSACMRHIDKYWEGEWYDSDGTPHLANAQACINILIESHHLKNVVDDRPAVGVDLNPVYAEMEGIMVKVKAKYGHMTPTHYTLDVVQSQNESTGTVDPSTTGNITAGHAGNYSFAYSGPRIPGR